MTRQTSTVALAARSIRKALKAKGYDAKVGVRTWNSVSVNLYDPSPKAYDEAHTLCKNYQAGHFCGMTDIYVSNEEESDLDQIEYVFVKREFSDEVRQGALDALATTYNLPALTLGKLPKTIALHRNEDEENTMDMLHNILVGNNFPIVKFWEQKETA